MKQTGNTTSIVIVFILIVAIALGAFWLLQSRMQTTQPENETVTQEDPFSTQPTFDEQVAGWQTLSTSLLTIKHPQEAVAQDRDGGVIIRYMGPKQVASGRTQTELFDGYAVLVEEVQGTTATSLEEVAKTERQNAVTNCQQQNGQVAELSSARINETEGFQYSATGCYMDYTETIVKLNNKFYRVTQSYVGEDADMGSYQEISNQIVATISFK